MRVIVADDSALFRQGLVLVLRSAGVDVVGEASDGPGVLEAARQSRPDVAIVDIRMPPAYETEGLAAALELRAAQPGIGVVILSQYVETRHVDRLLGDEPEGVGYVLKDRVADAAEFVDAVRRVAAGGTVIDPEVVALLLGRRRRRSPVDELTRREREVLELMAQGLSNQAICDLLVLSPKTIEAHVRSVFGKLGLDEASGQHRRVLAVLAYLRA